MGKAMSSYKIISDYMTNDKYRKSFNELAKDTFGLDFEPWYERELFYDRYVCYSYLYEDEVVANVSINKMNLIIDGEKKRALQLGTVMTHKAHRNKGLSASLINHIIEKYEGEYDLIYLFANETVLDFYPKFGFKQVVESCYELDAKAVERKETRVRKIKVHNEEDSKLIWNLVQGRQPISEKLGVLNDLWPLKVYCMYKYEDSLYYLENEDIIVVLQRENETLHLYDVISSKPIDLDRIIEKLVMDADEKIEFHFVPQFSKYNPFSTLKGREGDTLFVRSKESLFNEVLFPRTSHT